MAQEGLSSVHAEKEVSELQSQMGRLQVYGDFQLRRKNMSNSDTSNL